jgi:hypothetical protein
VALTFGVYAVTRGIGGKNTRRIYKNIIRDLK